VYWMHCVTGGGLLKILVLLCNMDSGFTWVVGFNI
jgi:hypothetical protein